MKEITYKLIYYEPIEFRHEGMTQTYKKEYQLYSPDFASFPYMLLVVNTDTDDASVTLLPTNILFKCDAIRYTIALIDKEK